jgi:dTDP-4-dehydrorhamnose reductase
MKIFTIGGSGLVGSRIKELLASKYVFDDLSLTDGVDITDPSSLEVLKNDTDHQIVIHLAAKTDVDGCEADRPLGEAGDAYKINVTGTSSVADACLASGKKLIYISTDFVFAGTRAKDSGGYVEADIPHPINWYGETKYRGEEEVRNSGVRFMIARLAYPYRKEFAAKLDFVRAIRDRLAQSQEVFAVTDHVMTPTFIDDFVNCIDVLMLKDAEGIFHVTGDESLTPYEAVLKIAQKFGFNINLIKKTTRAEYLKGKAQRPFNVSMNNGKIKKLGIKMRGFEEGLAEMI